MKDLSGLARCVGLVGNTGITTMVLVTHGVHQQEDWAPSQRLGSGPSSFMNVSEGRQVGCRETLQTCEKAKFKRHVISETWSRHEVWCC